jgi:large subunit ribosomal protein L25
MAAFKMSGLLRKEFGKGAARRLRSQQLVPAVIYGGTEKETVSVAITPKELAKAVLGPKRRNTLIELSLADDAGKAAGTHLVMVKELQVHPVRRAAVHVDFIAVAADKPVTARVPVLPFGKSKATIQGARMQILDRAITIEALPDQIPEKIDFDITDAPFGVVRAKSIPLPEGVKVAGNPDAPVLSLRVPRGEKDAEPAAAAAAPAAKK